jgi:hypothetical protein
VDVRECFPVTERQAYLDSAAVACDAKGRGSSGILSIPMDGAPAMVALLGGRGVIVGAREKFLRASRHHFYNQEVDRRFEVFG